VCAKKSYRCDLPATVLVLAVYLAAGCGPQTPGNARRARHREVIVTAPSPGETRITPPAPQDVIAAIAVAREAHEAWVRHDLDRLFGLMHPQSALRTEAHGKRNRIFNELNDHRDHETVLGREIVRDFEPVTDITERVADSLTEALASPEVADRLVADPSALARLVVFLDYEVEGRRFRHVVMRDGAAWRLLTQPCGLRWPPENPER
jgi:hypothetical protein